MKEKLSKIYNVKIINYIFLLLPIIELITSISIAKTSISITPGSIYKFAFVIYAAIYLSVFNKYRRKEVLLGIVGLIGFAIINITITTDLFTNMLSSALDGVSKLITFTISFLFFICFIKNGNKLNLKIFTYVALLYTLLINIATITNTAIATYEGDLSLGTTGWYYSANELNVILSMLLPITLYNFAKRADAMHLITNILIVYSLLSIGSKTSLIAVSVALVAILIYSFIYMIKRKDIFSKRLFIYTSIICIFAIAIMPYTASYNHFIKRVNQSLDSEASITEQNKEELSKFVYNGRNEYLRAQKELFKDTSILEKLFGVSIENRIKGEDGINYKLIEMDPFDIATSFGYIGIIIYYMPVIFSFILFIYNAINKKKYTQRNVCILTSIILIICISCLAGHVLLSSTIVIFLAYWLAMLNEITKTDTKLYNLSFKSYVKTEMHSEKKKLFITTQRLSIGGMERALINLLNMSNLKDKFDIWLYVTYITDLEFLKKLPTNIHVHVVCDKKWNFLNKLTSVIKIFSDTIFMPHFDYSICYGHSNILLSRLARRASKQSIIFIHADLANRTSKQLKRLSRGMKFSKFIDVICVSNKAKTSYIRLIENREVQVINNYINAEEILASANEVNNFNVDGNCKNFVTVCRIEEKSKKISRIITATSILLTEGYNFKVYVIGTGPDEKRYKAQVNENGLQNNVIFLGAKINPYVYMKKCDVLLFSSLYEGYGIVLDEARVLGIPFISTEVADAKLIADEGFGIVCANSEEGLYNGMKQYLDNGFEIKSKFNYTLFNENITKALDRLLEE